MAFSQLIQAQSSFLPINRELSNLYEYHALNHNLAFHNSVRPFRSVDIAPVKGIDSLNLSITPKFLLFNVEKVKKDAHSRLVLRPLFSVLPAIDLSNNKSVMETSLGLFGLAQMGRKVSLSVNYISGNSGFANYVDSFIQTTEVVPGRGYAHPTKQGYSYYTLDGYVSYSPSKYFNFQLGQGRNFLGNGYRSLLLSDNPYSYPFFKLSTNIWNFKYLNLFTMMSNEPGFGGTNSKFGRKYASFHFLSWNVNKRLNIGVFESIIWQGDDSSGTRGFDINYLNPVIFYRPVEYSLGSSDNALLGLNIAVRLTRAFVFYGQLIIDEFLLKEIEARSGWWANKHGFQLGLKSFNFLKIKGLHFQTEVNYVRPYTYSHGLSLQNYSHYNQALAHPLGANFYESVSFLRYSIKGFSIEGMGLVAVIGADSAGSNWGGNIFLDYGTPKEQEFDNKVSQGVKTNLLIMGLKISYLLYPSINLRLESGLVMRNKISDVLEETSTMFYLGVKTELGNIYHDF